MKAPLLGLLLSVCLPAQPPYRIGGGVSAPVVEEKVEPSYTEEARTARVEGRVLLAIVVNEQGRPEQIQVLQSGLKNKDTGQKAESDHGLAQKAVEAMAKWRFKPGTKDGKPVPVKANVEIHFRLT